MRRLIIAAALFLAAPHAWAQAGGLPLAPAQANLCGQGDLDGNCKLKASAAALTALSATIPSSSAISAAASSAASAAMTAANPLVSIGNGATGHVTPMHFNGVADDVVPTMAGDASGTMAASVIMGLRGSFRNLAIANLVPLNATGDHATFAITTTLAPFVLKEVDAANCTGTPILLKVSIWTGPNATGTQLVASTLLSGIPGITGIGVLANASGINSPRQSGLQVYLHVDIANLAALTCSFYLQGVSALDATQIATTVTGY